MSGSRLRRARTIIILCEGRTEMVAVEHFVKRQWNAEDLKSIALHPINLKAKLDDVFGSVVRFRKDPKVLAVFTLIDLYPMNRVRDKGQDTVDEKVEAARAWLRRDFDAALLEFFHPHLSVHELEAWLLADGQCIGPDVEPLDKAEEKDFQNPPKARVNAILKRRRRGDGYHEVSDGTTMFKKARFDVVYQSCPYFEAFYDDLKQVAETALKELAV